jgi:hypothetical protein
VLAPNVPIPAHDTGDRSGNILAGSWFPRVTAPTRRAGAWTDIRPTYAKGRFKIKPGVTKTVKAKLTKAGRRLMRKRRSSSSRGPTSATPRAPSSPR